MKVFVNFDRKKIICVCLARQQKDFPRFMREIPQYKLPLGGSSVMALSLDETTPLDIHSELFDRLQPVQYNFINGDGRICYGLIAQDVLSSMESLGIGENELDLVHHEFHKDTGEEKETFGIAYNNLIAMLIHEMQKSKMQIATLQAEINELKGL